MGKTWRCWLMGGLLVGLGLSGPVMGQAAPAAPAAPPAAAPEAPAVPAPPPHAVRQRLVQVAAPEASLLSVNETHGLLLLGVAGKAQQLRVYKLAADGTLPAAPAQIVDLPRPAKAPATPSQLMAAVWHPRLPLVYLWQDLPELTDASPERPVLQAEFNHLLIYRIANGQLTLVTQEARGPGFLIQPRAGLALAPDGSRLFVPNTMEGGRASVGYYDLDAAGALVPVQAPIKGSLDGFGMAEFEPVLRPTSEPVNLFRAPPAMISGLSFHRETLVFTGTDALITWDTSNRLASFGVLQIPGAASSMAMVAHPRLPLLYLVPHQANHHLVWVPHAEGWPALLPRTLASPGCYSPPVVVEGPAPALVCTTILNLIVWPLAADGAPTGELLSYPLKGKYLRALAYAPKANRVFVAVAEVTP